MPGKKKPTMADVAKLAGVSLSTVSLVLHGRRSGRDRISDETRARIHEAVAQLGYITNQYARNLRRRRTDRICLWLSRLGLPYNDTLADALNHRAEQEGYSTIVISGSTAQAERQMLYQLQSGLADGVLVVAPNHLSSEDFSTLARSTAAVVVQSNFIEARDFDVVCTNEEDVCYQAIWELLKAGRRRIAFMGALNDRAQSARYASYGRAVRDFGANPDEPGLCQDIGFSRRRAYHTTVQLLGSSQPPDAIFAASDIAAISAIWAARDNGWSVPDQLAVIGVGNIPEGEIIHPALTTVGPVNLDFQDALDLLFTRLSGAAPAEGRVRQVQWELIRRGSA